jgi:hypothetical protein
MSNFSGATDWIKPVLPLTVSRIGMLLAMAPTTTGVMESTPVQQSGMRSQILSTTRQIGSVFVLFYKINR